MVCYFIRFSRNKNGHLSIADVAQYKFSRNCICSIGEVIVFSVIPANRIPGFEYAVQEIEPRLHTDVNIRLLLPGNGKLYYSVIVVRVSINRSRNHSARHKGPSKANGSSLIINFPSGRVVINTDRQRQLSAFYLVQRYPYLWYAGGVINRIFHKFK